jgi:hypothetical protein
MYNEGLFEPMDVYRSQHRRKDLITAGEMARFGLVPSE